MSDLKIVVIGGVAAGPKAAARAKRCDPSAQVTLVEKGEWISYGGCGLPDVYKRQNQQRLKTSQTFCRQQSELHQDEWHHRR